MRIENKITNNFVKLTIALFAIVLVFGIFSSGALGQPVPPDPTCGIREVFQHINNLEKVCEGQESELINTYFTYDLSCEAFEESKTTGIGGITGHTLDDLIGILNDDGDNDNNINIIDTNKLKAYVACKKQEIASRDPDIGNNCYVVFNSNVVNSNVEIIDIEGVNCESVDAFLTTKCEASSSNTREGVLIVNSDNTNVCKVKLGNWENNIRSTCATASPGSERECRLARSVRRAIPPGDTEITSPIESTDVQEAIDKIIKWLTIFSAPILVLMTLIGAGLYMFSGGDANKRKGAISFIKYAIIGFVVLLLAYIIESIIKFLF